jgi:CheY-like chemotaxis protein
MLPFSHEPAKRKVLVVDDEHVIANTLALILNQNGFEATAVYGGPQAVAAATNLRPDISLIDIIMGAQNGIDTAIAIMGLHPHCRIVLISGDVSSAVLLDEAREAGHDFEILPKPFHPEFLLDRLQA